MCVRAIYAGQNLRQESLPILHMLPRFQHLQSLNLNGNNIGDDGASYVATALVYCRRLRDVDLRWNGIGDHGAGVVAQVLPQCHSLALFLIRFNCITANMDGVLQAVAPGHCDLDLRRR